MQALFNSKTGNQIKPGMSVITFRGQLGTLVSFKAPRHAGSTGRVYVTIGTHTHEFFPSVINAEIREVA